MKTVLEITQDIDTPVKLEQAANYSFRVTYGKHVLANMTYEEAFAEFGACILHSATCAGLVAEDPANNPWNEINEPKSTTGA